MLSRVAAATTRSPGGSCSSPALALLITTLAFNLLGDGVRDALDPRGERLFGRAASDCASSSAGSCSASSCSG